MDVTAIYRELLGHFGPQDWWPVKHSFRPKEFEICIGAMLTQNTNWRNVGKALGRMRRAGLVSPESVMKAGDGELEDAVRPSGFYRQKAERLRLFSRFVLSFGSFRKFAGKVTRDELLALKGTGPETADSILLYALGRPVFVIDAYTRRMFTRLGFGPREGYEGWRKFFEMELPGDVRLYREFHALIVEHAKRYCKVKPLCSECPLNEGCAKKL